MATGPIRILVCDDDAGQRAVMQVALTDAGYEVSTAVDGQDALEKIKARPPDLLLSDVDMPRMNGIELIRSVRKNHATMLLPVMMLTGSADKQTRLQGIKIGVDEYIAKPIDPDELVARVQNKLGRIQVQMDSNPLTQLPGNSVIERNIQSAIQSKAPLAVLYLDLNYFKAFNDAYGFLAGDAAIRGTAQALKEAVQAVPPGDDFIGHIGGDDFIIITRPDRAEALCRKVVERFGAFAPSLYKDEDRARGFTLAKDRDGQAKQFPLLSIAIGVVSNQRRPIESLAEFSRLGAEMKKKAKSLTGSGYALDA